MGTNNYLFDKEKFAELLDRAKGDRSINKYAEESGISAAHISRFLRKLISNPPTPETITKLSLKAHNNISYRDFMVAAGHITVDDSVYPGDPENKKDLTNVGIVQRAGRISRISPLERRRQYEEGKKRYFQIILSHLYGVDYPWSIKKPEGKSFQYDMVIDVDYRGYKKWILEFRPSPEERTPALPLILNAYGRFVTMDFEPTDKLTIVVNTENYFEQFFKCPPKALRANLHVMLVDLGEDRIVKEEKLTEFVF